jgi:hypothetical protein
MSNCRYTPKIHDQILTEMNQKWRRTDQEIADEMGFDRATITTNRNRLGLPRNSRPKLPQFRESKRELLPPKEKPNPLKIASMWLDKRLVEKPSGYWLDDVPVNLDAIMQAANLLMKRAGAEQCCYSEKWRV